MKNCELCSGGLARMHCESDQASLCWDCDSKVHGANFLVAKHTRTLLCHVCQNPTPWLASGQHIAAAVSVCESCVANNDNNTTVMTPEPEESSEGEYDDDDDDDEEEEGEEDDYDEEEEEEEEADDAENQVVPEDSSSFSMSKPVASSDSLSSTEVGGGGGSGLKRMRESTSFCSDDEIGCYSSHVRSVESSSSTSSSSSRLLKQPRLAAANNSARNQDHLETESSRSTAIITSLKRLQNHMNDDASATIMGICRLSRDQSR